MRKIAMRCTQEQFESIKDRIKCEIYNLDNFKEFPYLINCHYGSVTNLHTSSNKNREVYETFDSETFLKACDSREEEKVQYEVYLCGQWYETRHLIRVKTQPNYSKEIEALQLKAKENGMKCIINFEKI